MKREAHVFLILGWVLVAGSLLQIGSFIVRDPPSSKSCPRKRARYGGFDLVWARMGKRLRAGTPF